jgi:hypothetical protein
MSTASKWKYCCLYNVKLDKLEQEFLEMGRRRLKNEI